MQANSSLGVSNRSRRSIWLSLALLAITSFLASSQSLAQTTYFTESFEGSFPGSNFSVQGVGTGWTQNTIFASAGAKSAYLRTVATQQNMTLESRTINLSTSTTPFLSFSHIAGLEKYFDHGYVEVSSDNGLRWTVVQNTAYYGNSWRKTGSNSQITTVGVTNYADGPFFDGQSRLEWDDRFISTSSVPLASDWRKEVFDLSAFKSQYVKIRFRVKSNIQNDWFGWLVDDIKIYEAPTSRLTGTRVIGSGGFANLTAAVAALADSGVGSGGVTFLISSGNYLDSVNMGSWRGVSASNRVRFVGNGAARIERGGQSSSPSVPSQTAGYSYTSIMDAVILMSGTDYVTFDKLTVGQYGNANGNYHAKTGWFMTNGCTFDSIVNCKTDMSRRSAYVSSIVIQNTINNADPKERNIQNKLVNDTISSWCGIFIISGAQSVLDDGNEIVGTSAQQFQLTLGPTASLTPLVSSTHTGIACYGQENLKIKNIKLTYSNYNSTSTMYGIYLANLLKPQITDNLLTDLGLQAYLCQVICMYVNASTTIPVIEPVIRNNTIRNVVGNYAWGIYAFGMYDPLIEANTLEEFNSFYYNYGIYLSGGQRARVIGNRIKNQYMLANNSTTSAVTSYGILLSGFTGPNVIYNNMLANMKGIYASASNNYYAIQYSQSGGSRDSICYNSIWMAGGSGVNGAETSNNYYGLYLSPTSTAGAQVIVKNNLIVNRMDLGASSKAYCIYRATTAGNVTCDYNCYYGPTDANDTTIRKIGFWSNDRGLLTQWRQAGGTGTVANPLNDLHSFSELPTLASDSLHISPSVATRLKGAGQYLETVTKDFDGDTRSSNPDIGADQGSMTASSTDDAGPAISTERVRRTTSTSGVSVYATISDASGVNTNSNASPRLWHRASTGSSFSAVSGSLVSGNSWKFDMPGYSAGSTVYYFIAAQDASGSNNLTVEPIAATGVTPPGNTAISNPPHGFDTLFIAAPLSGPYTVGSGQNYTTIKNAIDALNNNGVSGPVTFLLNAATFTENTDLTIQAPIMGGSATNTVTFKPHSSQANVTVTLGFSSLYGFRVNGASNIIFDGSNQVGGTTRNLTLQANVNNQQGIIQVVPAYGWDRLVYSPENITIKNLRIRGLTVSSSNSASYGVQALYNASAPKGAYRNLTIENNELLMLGTGVRQAVTSPEYYTNRVSGIVIRNNIIGSTTDSIYNTGILIQGGDSTIVEGNDIQKLRNGTVATTMTGISIGLGNTYARVVNNKVHDVWNRGTSGTVVGIGHTGTNFPQASRHLIANNMVYDLHNPSSTVGTTSTASFVPVITGIQVGISTGDFVVNNTVYLFDTVTNSTQTVPQYTAAIALTSNAVWEATILNNIFYNYSVVGPIYGRNAGLVLRDGSQLLRSDRNLWAVPHRGSFSGIYAWNALSSSWISSIDSLRVLTGMDQNSFVHTPPFMSVTDPHLLTNVPTLVESNGRPFATITKDIDGVTRNTNTPDIGAQEGNFMTYYTADIEPTGAFTPLRGTKYVATTGVRSVISVTNNGTATAFNVPIKVTVIDSVNQLNNVTVSTIVDSIRSTETRIVTLDSVSFPLVRSYGVRIFADLTADGVRTNDTLPVIGISTIPGLNGIYTVGSGGWAPTINAAFDSLKFYGIGGQVTFRLIDDVYHELPIITTTGGMNNTGVLIGANDGRRVRIKPAPGKFPTVHFYGNTSRFVTTYSIGSTYCGLGLENMSFLTIDGSNTENGTSRDMTLRWHPNASYPTHPMIVMQGIQFDSIKNCVLIDSMYLGPTSIRSNQGIIYLTSNSTLAQVRASKNYIYNNHFRDSYYGIYGYGYPTSTSGYHPFDNYVQKNTFTRFYYGMYFQYVSSMFIEDNDIYSDTLGYHTSQYGIYMFSPYNGGHVIQRNRITKFRSSYSSPTYYGMSLNYSGPGGQRVQNNVIALDHDANSGSSTFYGIQLQNAITPYGPTQIYNNTIYIGGTGTGTSYALYRASGSDMDCRNNLIHMRRNGANYVNYINTNTYAFASESNLIFAGGTSSNYPGYFTPNNYSTLSAWRSGTSLDLKSYFESSQFVDSVGANFALKANVATRAESHGEPIPGLTTDINGNTRHFKYPDIGAYEGTYTSNFDVNLTALAVTSPAPNTRYFVNSVVTAAANFKQNGNVNQTNVPILYQAIDANGVVKTTQASTISTLNAGATAAAGDFTFTPTTPGFWTIRAIAASPTEEWTLDDTVSIQIRVMNGLNGNYTVGVGQFAPTIKAAFDSLDDGGIRGNVNFILTDASYSEPPITQNPVFGENSSFRVTFKPNIGVNPTITFNSTVARPWGIRLNSAKYFTFEGSNITNGTSRNTTWQTNANGKAVFWFADSIGNNGTQNMVIQNNKIIAGSMAGDAYGVYVGGATLNPATGGTNNVVTIQNNEIKNAGYGVWLKGLSTSTLSQSPVVNGNLIGSLTPQRIGVEGIRLENTSSASIRQNEVLGVYAAAGSVAGIDLAGANVASVVGKNKVHDVQSKSGGRAVGILDNGGATAATKIQNNMIWGVISGMTGTTNTSVNAGIYLGSSTSAQIAYNSISLVGNRDTTGIGASAAASAALYISASAASVEVKNNILVNKQTEVLRNARSYGYVVEAASSIASSDNNNIFGSGTQGTHARVGSTDYVTMPPLRIAMGNKDLLSFMGDAPFLSTTDLHLNTGVPTRIEGGATAIVGITDDIDGNPRQSPPDIGASEGNFTKAVDVIAVGIDNPINGSVYRPFGKTTAPIVTFRNGATGTGTNIPVTFVTYDSTFATIRTSVRTIPILGPGQSVQVTFDSIILGGVGSYGLWAYAGLASDVDYTNDTTAAFVVKVCDKLLGDYNVGIGKDYPSLTVALLAICDCGVRNDTRLWLTDDNYVEPAPIRMFDVLGVTNAIQVTVKPAPGKNPVTTITSSPTANYGILLDSVSWINFDGSNTVGGSTRNWTLKMGGANANASVFSIADGSRNSIRNMNIDNLSANSGAGISISSNRIRAVGNTVANNDIRRGAIGIQLQSSAQVDSLVSITRNNITRFGQTGIAVGDRVKDITIANNTIKSDSTLAVSSLTGVSVAGSNTMDVKLNANFIGSLVSSNVNPVLTAVSLANASGSATLVTNNAVAMERTLANASATVTGLQMGTLTSARVIGNTVAIGGNGVSAGSSYAVSSNAQTSLTMYNNILSNTRSNSAGAAGKHYALYVPTLPASTISASDYNSFNASGNGGAIIFANGTTVTTLPMWRMLSHGTPYGLLDNNSIVAAPNFMGAEDLRINAAIANRFVRGGMPGTANDWDFNSTWREWMPSIGAYEITGGTRLARLNGTYTIGEAGSQFATLADAVAALNANGVDGAVTIWLANKTEKYSQPIRLVASDGLSQTNRATFRAAQGGRSMIIGEATGLPYVLAFDSAAHHIAFDGDNNSNNRQRMLSIENNTLGASNSAVWISNGASDVGVRNAILTTRAENRGMPISTDIASGGQAVVVVAGGPSGGDVMNAFVENDSILYGSSGVYAGGFSNTDGRVSNLMVSGSTIQDFNSTGIYFAPFARNSTAHGNRIRTFNMPGTAPTMRGIRLSSHEADQNTATANWVIDVRSSGASNVSGIEVSEGMRPLIANNFISLSDNTSGSVRGIDEASLAASAATGARILFNSINLYGTRPSSSSIDYGIAILGNANANGDSVLNNIIAMNRIGGNGQQLFALGIVNANDLVAADYNDYWNANGNAARIGGIGYPTLGSLQVIPSWSPRDVNSISGDPKFVSDLDLHLASYESAVFNKGFWLGSVQTDIDGQSRDKSPKTEIGADENGFFGTLPVEIAAFRATGRNARIDVVWESANEKDLFGFAVLRANSADGIFDEIANASSNGTLRAKGHNGNATDYAFADAKVENGVTYYYKLVSVDLDGTRTEHGRIASATPMAENAGFAIEAIRPNPFQVGTGRAATIGLSIPDASTVEITVADIAGREIRSLSTGDATMVGASSIEWDGRDTNGELVANGTYLCFVKLTNANGEVHTATQKIVVTR